MRKNYEAKNTLYKKTIVWIMTVLMIGSLFAVIFFGLQGGSQGFATHEYRDFKFTNINGVWSTVVDDRETFFSLFPTDVEDIDVDPAILDRLRATPQIVLTSDVNDTNNEAIALAQFQLAQTMSPFGVFVAQGFADTNETSLPQLSCEDATSFVPVIYFKTANDTVIYQDGNCIVAETSRGPGFTRIKDRLTYGIFNII